VVVLFDLLFRQFYNDLEAFSWRVNLFLRTFVIVDDYNFIIYIGFVRHTNLSH
jgi:hypothetical protein